MNKFHHHPHVVEGLVLLRKECSIKSLTTLVKWLISLQHEFGKLVLQCPHIVVGWCKVVDVLPTDYACRILFLFLFESSLGWCGFSPIVAGFLEAELCFPRVSADDGGGCFILAESHDKRSLIFPMELRTEVVLVDVPGASSVRGTFVGRASKGFFGAFRVSHLMTLCCFNISAWNKRLCFIRWSLFISTPHSKQVVLNRFLGFGPIFINFEYFFTVIIHQRTHFSIITNYTRW